MDFFKNFLQVFRNLKKSMYTKSKNDIPIIPLTEEDKYFQAKERQKVFENIQYLKNLVKQDVDHKHRELLFSKLVSKLGIAECYETVRQERWAKNIYCPNCKSHKVIQIKQSDPKKSEHNYRYNCHACDYQFNDDSDTPLEDIPPINSWIQCWYLLCFTDSNVYIANKLKLDINLVNWMIKSLQKIFNKERPSEKLKSPEEWAKESSRVEKTIKSALKSKKDLLLGKEIVNAPVDTAEERRLKENKRNPNKNNPKGKK